MIHAPRNLRAAVLAGLLMATATPAFAGRQKRIDINTLQTPLYTVEDDAFVRHNGDSYNNRPLYCNHIYALASSAATNLTVYWANDKGRPRAASCLPLSGKRQGRRGCKTRRTLLPSTGRAAWNGSSRTPPGARRRVHLEEVPTGARGRVIAARVTVEASAAGRPARSGRNGAAFIAGTQTVLVAIRHD